MGNIDRLLDENLTSDLVEESTTDIRDLRTECVQEETALSYLRRIAQGRLDIVRNESVRRADGEETARDLSDLIGDLPEILGQQPRPAGPGRLPQSLDPTEIDPELASRLDAIASPSRIATLSDLQDDAMATIAADLNQFERHLSDLRRSLFAQIDALQTELTRRYETGEADSDSLLT